MKMFNDHEITCQKYLKLLVSIENLERKTDLSKDLQKDIDNQLQQLEKEILRQSLYDHDIK